MSVCLILLRECLLDPGASCSATKMGWPWGCRVALGARGVALVACYLRHFGCKLSLETLCLRTQVMDLDSWLRCSDSTRKRLGLGDAWAEGNTDCAFRIKDITAVQRSHRGNDWNYWGGDLAQVCLCACWVGQLRGGSSSVHTRTASPAYVHWLISVLVGHFRPQPWPLKKIQIPQVLQILLGRCPCFFVSSSQVNWPD